MRIKRRLLGDLEVGLERGSNHPIDRQQHDDQQQRYHEPAEDVLLHDSPARRSIRTAARAIARMIRPMVRNSAAA